MAKPQPAPPAPVTQPARPGHTASPQRVPGSQAPGAPILQLTRLSKTYGRGAAQVRALDNLTLDLMAGWTAIMGPSGSGKSTLLLAAAGLLRVSGGQVTLLGRDITRASSAQLTELRRTTIGFIFQQYNLVPSLSAALNVELPLRLTGKRPPRGAARAALAQVGLVDRAGARPDQLSGGQQQRVAIARALVTRPQVIFADEPTGALDLATSRAVLDLLSGVGAQGTSIVTVTHDPIVAARADRVVFLLDGRVAGIHPRMAAADISAALSRLEEVPA